MRSVIQKFLGEQRRAGQGTFNHHDRPYSEIMEESPFSTRGTRHRHTASRRSVLCLPIGAYEQHGPHLPLNTDTIIAERFTARLLERHGEEYDLWSLPALPYGLSLEHAWSPGTISLTLGVFAGLLDAGNRGILDSDQACSLAGSLGGTVRELDVADVPSPADVGGVEFTGRGTDTRPTIALESTQTPQLTRS